MYTIYIDDQWNDIFIEVEQKFNTYEEAVNYILAQDDTAEQIGKYSWTDGHDLYMIVPYT